MKKAATIKSFHQCPMGGNRPHIGGNATQGSSNVFIENQPALRKGDQLYCNNTVDMPKVQDGSRRVFINGVPAARTTDPTSHQSTIKGGANNVYIGG